MRRLTLLAVLLLGGCSRVTPPRHWIATHATWDGARWNCPAGTDVYADETGAITGKPFDVYCVYGEEGR